MKTPVDAREPMDFEQDVLDLALESLQARQGSSRSAGAHSPITSKDGVMIVAAALAIAIALPIALPGGGTGGADPAAAALLHRVALRAAQQPPEPAPRPGQYLYTRSESAATHLYVVGDGTTFMFEAPGIRESWIGPDGSGRILNTPGTVTFPTQRDRAAWLATGAPSLEWVVDGDGEFDHFGPGRTDVRRLRRPADGS